MLGATLEQAQLDQDVVTFVTRPGMYRGEAIVTLTNEDAATRCAQHFNGRRWDVSGIAVTAKLISEEITQCKPAQSDGYAGHYNDGLVADTRLDDMKLLERYEARVDREGGWDDRNLDTFGEDSCDHDDLVAQVFANSTHSSMLSASAPVFVPGKVLSVHEDVASTDVSTEDGDSVSSCDEKEPKVVQIPWQ